jgi:peptidoglycan/xylan/chitin deacetylase (PgdA/CDA1 family)
VIALSFDDGPCPQTQSLLDALSKKEVKTTFFLIGQNITGNNAAARAIYEAGHELANHSDGYSGNPNQQNVQTCSDKIKNITGSNPTLFRAPNVDYGGGAVDNVCKALNLSMIDVSCWSNDYNGINSTQIRSNVKGCAGDGKIVNLHEFNTATGNNAAGIEGLIDDLRVAGYWILPVGQMAVYKGITLEGGKKYFSF